MSELFNEIEDDLRRERLDRLSRRFGKMGVIISVVVVLGTAVSVVIKDRQRAQAMAKTSELIEGGVRFDAGDYKGAVAVFSHLADNSHSAYYGIAMLRKAEAQEAAGDKKGAAETYETLAAQDGTLNGLARLHSPEGQVITPNPKSPFYYSQREWQGWQLLSADKKDEAATQFLALRNDPDVPYTLRNRMQDVVQQLAPEKAMSDDSMSDKSIKKDK